MHGPAFICLTDFRSGTEHERIVEALRPADLVLDVCAGVGPFAVPAMMMGCAVYANDINPECVKWMQVNMTRNQRKKSRRECHIFNLDGREFLRNIALPRIDSYQQEMSAGTAGCTASVNSKIVIVMNLPGLALTFLDVVTDWLSVNSEEKQTWTVPVHIHCYTFTRADDRDGDVRERLKDIMPSVANEQISCRFVRKTAPKKDMMCVHIRLFDPSSCASRS